MKQRVLPFKGIKVIEFAWVAVGPLSSRYLADYGATVIKMESHTRLDTLRVCAPFKDNTPGVDRSGWWADINANKYSIGIRMDMPKGRDVIWKLVKWADIIIEGYVPGTMKKMGLDYDSVKKVKPDIIYLSTCSQGQYGPHAETPGFGPMMGFITGINYLCGDRNRMPTSPYGAYNDFICPRFNGSALIAALVHRRRTGKGTYIDQSQIESGLQFFSPLLMDYFANGQIAERNGNRLSYAAPHGVYRCKGDDRWCAITVFSDEEWRAFSRVVKAEWTRDPKFSTLIERKQREDELDELVEGWTKNFTPEEVMALMQKEGVAASQVEDTRDLFKDPQLQHRGHFRPVDHKVFGRFNYNSLGFRLANTPSQMKPSPCLGEHNEYVFKDILGMSDDEISELLIQGVATTEDDVGVKPAM